MVDFSAQALKQIYADRGTFTCLHCACRVVSAARIRRRRNQQAEDSGIAEETLPQASILPTQRRSPRVAAMIEATRAHAVTALHQTGVTEE